MLDLDMFIQWGQAMQRGSERFSLFPVHADGARGGSLRRGVPQLGEHSREILVELGFDDAQIADLVRAGAVKT